MTETIKSNLKNKLTLNMKSWVKFGLFWGLFMVVAIHIVFPLLDGKSIVLMELLVSIPLWILFGLVFGYVSRKKEPKKQTDK